MSVTEKLLASHRIISDQIKFDELKVLLRELEQVLVNDIQGDVVELGCYEGTSALFEMRMLQELTPEKTLWLYDSFEGLPPKTKEDLSVAGELFTAGKLRAQRSQLKRNFVKADLPMPEIIKSWFNELLPEDLPDKICFAFLDGDFYHSIYDSLLLVWPKMTQGGVVVIDDYFNAKLPGAKKAVHEFFGKDCTISVDNTLAIIEK